MPNIYICGLFLASNCLSLCRKLWNKLLLLTNTTDNLYSYDNKKRNSASRQRDGKLLPFVIVFYSTTSAVLMSISNLCRFKSDKKSLANALDYEKVETERLRDENST